MSIHQIMMKRRLAVLTATPLVINPILQRVLDYADANAITTPTGATLTALNTYCNALESSGILAHTGAGGVPTSASDFTTSDVFVNFAYNDTGLDEFSLIDWIRLVEMDVYGGMTYTDEGWEGNGVDGYVDTLWNPSTDGVNYLLDDAMFGCVQYKDTGNINLLGTPASTGVMNLYNADLANHRINSGSSLNAIANLTGLGYKSSNRINSTDVQLYNSTTKIDRTAASSSISNVVLSILRRGGNYSDNGVSSYLAGKAMTESQNNSVVSTTNTYLSAIGLTPIA